MIKKEIRNRIKELEERLSDLKTSKDSRVLSAKKVYEDIYTQVDEELDKSRDEIKEEISKLDDLVKAKKRPMKEVPKELKEWVKYLGVGIDKSEKWQIVWYSKNLKYIIVRKPGHMYWGGIGMPQNYGPSIYVLYYIQEIKDYRSGEVYSIEGRLTKERFQEMIDKVPEESREGIKIR
jgi:gas vesicle protein